MKSIKTISDPEAFKLLGDETRRRMVFLLRAKEMTVGKVAQELDLTPQAVYHHIKKLLDAGMVEVTKEKRVAHLIESYYRATAEIFNCSVGEASKDSKAVKEQIETALSALKKLGFKIEYDDKVVSKLADLDFELEGCCKASKYEDAISELKDVDIFTKIRLENYVAVLSMSDEEHAKELEIENKFRSALRSLVKK